MLKFNPLVSCAPSRVGRSASVHTRTIDGQAIAREFREGLMRRVGALAAKGVRHVQVICPGFAVDCLETLEEIAMQNRERFEEAGGERLEYIPALNDSVAHAEALRKVILDRLEH